MKSKVIKTMEFTRDDIIAECTDEETIDMVVDMVDSFQNWDFTMDVVKRLLKGVDSDFTPKEVIETIFNKKEADKYLIYEKMDS